MADLIALGPYGLGDRPQRPSLRSQALHFADRLLLGLVRDKSTVVAAAVAERLLASVRLAQQSVVSLFMRARHVQVRATLVGETQRDLLAPTIVAVGEDGPGRSLAVDRIVGGVRRWDALPVSAALRLREVGLIQRSSPK